MLDMKQLRQDIDELAAHNKEIFRKHKIDQVAFCPHFDSIGLLDLVRLVRAAGMCGYLRNVHFGNQTTLFATFATERKQEFVIDSSFYESK